MALVTFRHTVAGQYTGKNAPLTTREVDDNFFNINTELGQKATLSFTNVLVSGQPTVVADSANDTLTLVAGSGINITTDAATDSITLSVQNAGAVQITAEDTAILHYPVLASGTGTQTLKIDPTNTPFSYNPSTSLISAGALSLTGDITANNFVALSSTVNLVNTVATTVNFAGAATSLTIAPNVTSLSLGNNTAAAQTVNMFGASTGASTYNFATGATANATTKTLNIGTGGATGSTTNINIGSSAGGQTILNSPTTTIQGNLVVNGTTTTINSTTQTLDDPVITLGGDTAPTVDDNKDRGVEFRWHNGTAAQVGFFGFDDSTGYFTFIPSATNTAEVFSGTLGDFQATNFRGALIGNADTASKWLTARTISLAGDLTGSVSIDGSANVTLTATIAPDSVALGTDTTGNYASSVSVSGNGLTITGAAGEGTAFTVNSNATAANTASTIVFRDATNNFSAGTITAALSGNATTATTLQTARNFSITGNATAAAVSFNGSADVALNVTSLTAGGLTGTIPSAVLGNSTLFVGTTAVALNRASANQALTGITSVQLPGATSGTITLQPAAVAGTNTLTLPAQTATLATLNDIGNGALTLAVAGTGLSGSATFTANQTAATTFTVTSNATSANTANTIVSRDANGNFSAGTITVGAIVGTHELELSTQLVTTSTAAQTIISQNTAQYRSAEFRLQASQGTNYSAVTIRAIHDGTNVNFVEYGQVGFGASLGTYDVTLTGTAPNQLFNLVVTPTSATSTTFKVIADYITV